MAASIPVAIASNQSAVPASQSGTWNVALSAGSNLAGKVGIDQTTPGTTNAVSLAQIGATTVATGNGVVGAGVQRVSIASDNTAFAVNATLSAETTKVIGTIRIVGNGGATLDSTVGAGTAPTNQVVVGALYNSTEISPTTGQAFALQADSKGRIRQVIMDAAGNTRGANVDANSNLGVVLAAETTKVLGVVRNADGAGNLLTTNSTTFTAKFGLDTNLLGTLGTAFTTAGFVDIKGADGNVFVRQTTAANLNMTEASAASILTSVQLIDDTVVAQGTALGTTKASLVGGSVTTAAPTFTTGQINQLSLTTSGALRVDLGATSANATAVKVDGSAVTQPVSGTVSITANSAVNVAQINGVTPLMGNGATGTGSARVTMANDNTGVANWGHGATAATVPAGATYKGARGTTALPTAVTDGQMVGAMADKFGRQVAVLGTVRDLRASQTTTISASTAETTIVTAGAAGIFNDLVMLIVSNTSAATNTRIDFRDATAGSVIFSLQAPGNQTVGFSVPGTSIPQTAAANNWTATCATSTTDIRIWAVYEKNK